MLKQDNIYVLVSPHEKGIFETKEDCEKHLNPENDLLAQLTEFRTFSNTPEGKKKAQRFLRNKTKDMERFIDSMVNYRKNLKLANYQNFASFLEFVQNFKTYNNFLKKQAQILFVEENVYKVPEEDARVGYANEKMHFEKISIEDFCELYASFNAIVVEKKEKQRIMNGISSFADYCKYKGYNVEIKSIYDPLEDPFI